MRDTGFTTTDLLITVVIVGVLAAFALPNLGSWLSATSISSATRAVATELQLTRMKAISRNTRMRIRYNTVLNTYQVEQEGNPNVWTNDGNLTTLPVRIDLQAAPTTVTYDTLGRAAFTPPLPPLGVTATITLGNTQGKQKQISLHLGGRVQVQ